MACTSSFPLLHRYFEFLGSVAEEGLLISYHSKEQGICTWEPAFAVRIHLSYLSPDRLAATSIPDVGMGHLFDPQFSHACPLLGNTSAVKTKQFAKHNPKRFHV